MRALIQSVPSPIGHTILPHQDLLHGASAFESGNGGFLWHQSVLALRIVSLLHIFTSSPHRLYFGLL
jgi:hypothetical protein